MLSSATPRPGGGDGEPPGSGGISSPPAPLPGVAGGGASPRRASRAHAAEGERAQRERFPAAAVAAAPILDIRTLFRQEYGHEGITMPEGQG